MNETITAIEKRAMEVSAEAAAIIICDQDSLTRANAESLLLKAFIKEVDDTFRPIYDAGKATVATTKETWDRCRIPPDKEYRRIKGDIGNYLEKQEQLRREAEHRIWLAEQEKIRAEAEARRVAEEALKKAAALEAKGQNEKAEQVLNKAAAEETKISEKIQANNAIASAPIPAQAKTIGFSFREDWDIELIDVALVPREYLMFDEVKARKVIRVSKGAVQIPGVKNIKKRIDTQR